LREQTYIANGQGENPCPFCVYLTVGSLFVIALRGNTFCVTVRDYLPKSSPIAKITLQLPLRFARTALRSFKSIK
jgi:hypothetical protein